MTVGQGDIPLDELISLRKKLHQHAELSGNELQTWAILREFILMHAPSGNLIDVGKTGLAAIFESGKDGPVILFRADTDALPIAEEEDFPNASTNGNVSHKCGHDGHSTILCGMACMLQKHKPSAGKIVLLFQPAEETGKGALEMLADPLFDNLNPDFVFALHNLPGYDEGTIIIKKEQFASASKGMIIKLKGKECHAAYPENGINPARAFTEIIQSIEILPEYSESFDNFILTTIVHASLGKPAFGMAAGEAVIMTTLRSYDNHNMQRLVHECRLIAEEKAKEHGLKLSIEWCDEFDETFNHPEAIDIIEKAAIINHERIFHLPYPFRWSEDFGNYTADFTGAMFGLGAGKDCPALHTEKYDFPDAIIATGVTMFYGIAEQILSVR